jgi:hypothetical protein
VIIRTRMFGCSFSTACTSASICGPSPPVKPFQKSSVTGGPS